MAQGLQKTDGLFSHEVQQSTDSITRFRFIVLGSDEVLINEACDTILGSRDDTKCVDKTTCFLKEASVSGRHVSVVKTPAYWLEELKTHHFFSSGVRSVKAEMKFCYSLVFPGPHAFLLVLKDPYNVSREHYLLKALSDVFGKNALDYSIVLFVHNYEDIDIHRNCCVRKCHKRFHILKNNEDDVLKLFHATEKMTNQKESNFLTKDLDLLKKAEAYFRLDFVAKYGEMESSLKTKMTQLEEQNSENVRELEKLREEMDAHKERETRLREELDASKSRETEFRQQIDGLKTKKYELKEELYALRYYKKHFHEKLSFTHEKETLTSENETLRGQAEQLTTNEQDTGESKDNAAVLPTITQMEVKLEEQGQEEPDRPITLEKNYMDVELKKQKKLLQTITLSTGSQHGYHTSTAAPSSSDKDRSLDEKGETESRGKDSQASDSHESEGFRRVRRESMERPENLSGREPEPQDH